MLSLSARPIYHREITPKIWKITIFRPLCQTKAEPASGVLKTTVFGCFSVGINMRFSLKLTQKSTLKSTENIFPKIHHKPLPHPQHCVIPSPHPNPGLPTPIHSPKILPFNLSTTPNPQQNPTPPKSIHKTCPQIGQPQTKTNSVFVYKKSTKTPNQNPFLNSLH